MLEYSKKMGGVKKKYDMKEIIKYYIIISFMTTLISCDKQSDLNNLIAIDFVKNNGKIITVKKDFSFLVSRGKVFLKVEDNLISDSISEYRNINQVNFITNDSTYSSIISRTKEIGNKKKGSFYFYKQAMGGRPMVWVLDEKRVFLIGDTLSLKEEINKKIIKPLKRSVTDVVADSLKLNDEVLSSDYFTLKKTKLKASIINEKLGISYKSYYKIDLFPKNERLSFRSYNDYVILAVDEKNKERILFYKNMYRDFGTDISGVYFINEKIDWIKKTFNLDIIDESKPNKVIASFNEYNLLMRYDEYGFVKYVSVLYSNDNKFKEILKREEIDSFFYTVK